MPATPYKLEMAQVSDGAEEEAKESMAPSKKQRANGRGVGDILSSIE
jgi:hypothetical protein